MATKTWSAAEGGVASVDANWSEGTKPVAGDDIVFNTTSVKNCTAFDLALALASFSINTGYTGSITQAASFSITSYLQQDGIFGFVSSYLTTCNGNFIRTAGSFASLYLKMTGDGSNLGVDGKTIYDLEINANISIVSSVPMWGFKLNAGKILTLDAPLVVYRRSGPAYFFTNLGQIVGSNTVSFYHYNTDATTTFGSISAPVYIRLEGTATASYSSLLGSSTTIGSSLVVISDHATYTITLNLNGHNLSVTGAVTLSVRGLITQNGGTCFFGSTYTQDGASSVFTQAGPMTVMGNMSITAGTFNVSSGFVKCSGTLTISTAGTMTVSDAIRAAVISVGSGGTLTVNTGAIAYYDSSYSNSGTVTGSVAKWPFPSEKGDDSVPFEMPKAGARF